MRSRISSLLTAGMAAVFATAMVVGSASASTSDNHSKFAKQGRAAGLTAVQTSKLQAKADKYLSELGGTQVALNKIDLNGKASVFIALPGEDHPRELQSQYGAQATDVNCTGGADYLHFCAYSGSNFGGDQIDMYTCGRYFMPFGSGGSWDNNQTAGTQAAFYRQDNSLIHYTAGAHSLNLHADWLPVYWVVNC
jgi:hypothetical protein